MGFKIPVVVLHNAYNAMPMHIADKLYGLTGVRIQAGLNNFKTEEMRQNIYALDNIIIIEDCDNASLESVKAALSVLAQVDKDKKIAVLSDVLECGDFADDIHGQIGEAATENNINKILVYGEKSRKIFEVANIYSKEKSLYFDNKAEIAGKLLEEARDGAAVLFKAGRGMVMERVLEDFKKLF